MSMVTTDVGSIIECDWVNLSIIFQWCKLSLWSLESQFDSINENEGV